MKTTKFIALSLVAAFTVLPACGQKKKKSKENKVVMFVHGDPKRMIQNATLDQVSPLTLDNISSFNGFHANPTNFIIEQEEQYNPAGYDEVEDSNSTDSDDEGDSDDLSVPYYSFRDLGGNQYAYGPTNSKEWPEMIFAVKDRRLNLVSFDGMPVTIEHYSLKKDGRAFSVLASFRDPKYGRALLSMVFADSSRLKMMPAEDKSYNFLYGHVPLKWEQEISVDLCGFATENQKLSVQKSVEAWFADPLRLVDEPSRGVAYSVKTKFAPYSDLNQHCVYLVNNFKDENSTNFYTAGVTFPILNLASKEQIDSDVFIFMDHVGAELNSGKASPTTIHELGHFFGLGHEFDDDSQGHEHYRSIMGYSDGTATIQKEDFKAIRSLYGESLTLTQPNIQ